MNLTGRPSSYLGPDGEDLTRKSINLAVYSHPGEGKTVLFGKGDRSVLFLTSDPEGTISARAQGNRFHSIDVTDYDELDEAYRWLKESKEPKQLGIRWVVWDSVTLFQDRVLIDDIMQDAVAENPKQEEFVPSRREYLINMNHLGQYLRQFVTMDYNFGASFHVMTTNESGGDGTLFMPQVQGKNMPSKVAGYFQIVGYLGKVKEGDRLVQRLLVTREGRYFAKDRWDALGHHLDHPTLPKIEQLVEARRAELIGQKQKAEAKPASPPTSRAAAIAARARAAAGKTN